LVAHSKIAEIFAKKSIILPSFFFVKSINLYFHIKGFDYAQNLTTGLRRMLIPLRSIRTSQPGR